MQIEDGNHFLKFSLNPSISVFKLKTSERSFSHARLDDGVDAMPSSFFLESDIGKNISWQCFSKASMPLPHYFSPISSAAIVLSNRYALGDCLY